MQASVGQRLLWLLEQFRGEEGAANCPIVVRLRGPLDVARLSTGIDLLTERHEGLRTTFEGRGRNLTQVINEPRHVEIRRVDLTGAGDASVSDEGLHRAMVAEIRRPIDAADWPMRVTLWQLGPDDHALCLNVHHLVTDGWSCGLVLRDLDLLTRPASERPSLPTLDWQYADWSQWQQDWLDGESSRAGRDYWSRQLGGAQLPDIPLQPRAADGGLDNGSLTGDIDREIVEKLQRVARARRTTLPSVMLAIYYIVLHRATGQTDLAVASFLSNRTRSEVQETVGLLANMVVLRADLGRARTFADVVAIAHTTVMDAFVHQGVPYQLLPADTITRPGRRDRRPDDVVFQMVPQPTARHAVAGADAEVLVVDALGTRFECELQLYASGSGLRAVLFFNRSRLDDAWAADLIGDYLSLVDQIAAGANVGLTSG